MEQGELSKLLFGRAGRLRLARWLVEHVEAGGYFYQSEAREGAGDVISEVLANLENFVKLGLIAIAPRDPGHGRRQYYRRLDNPLWSIFETALSLCRDPSQDAAAPGGRPSTRVSP